MHKERLLRLADLLDTVPPEQFDMGTWRCGAVACAAGWAATLPEFQALGFYCTSNEEKKATVVYEQPDGSKSRGITACQEFFDLDDEEDWFFCAGGYLEVERRDPKAVARKIRDFVAGKKVFPCDSLVQGSQ